MFEDPEKHFVFDEKTGLLGCKTPQAEACEKWLHLNRDGLHELRRDTYENVLGRTNKILNASLSHAADEVRTTLEFLDAYRTGEKPYALAGRRAFADSRALLKDVVKFFT